MPKAMVIDQSRDNEHVDFVKVRASGVIGVIHKATQGTGYVDPTYAQRKAAALKPGRLWGAYHFGTGFEANGANSMSLDQAKRFLSLVEARTGQRPMLYTGHYFNACVGVQPDSKMAEYRAWWAQYGSAPSGLHPTWPNYWLWQYADGQCRAR